MSKFRKNEFIKRRGESLFWKAFEREQKKIRKQKYNASYVSEVVSFFSKKAKADIKSDYSFSKNTYKVVVPKVFSFISNPDETLSFLVMLDDILANKKVRNLFIDHYECQELGLGASIVMDVLLMEARKQAKLRNRKIRVKGKFPKCPKVTRVLKGTGILKHLDIPFSELTAEESKYYVYFPLRVGRQTTELTSSTEAEKAATEIADYYNNCLSHFNFKLTTSGEKRLSKLIGEILDNAEEHGEFHKWYIIAYMDITSGSVGKSHLVIFNFGKTIFEVLNEPMVSEILKNKMSDLSSNHTARGYFSLTPKFRKEELWTLYSLQEGVSRFSFTQEGKDRGQGTVKMIEFFDRIGRGGNQQELPQMALISGGTRILFDGTYSLKPEKIDEEERKIIAFNSSNDLNDMPDINYVHAIGGFFPGTVLTLNFFFSKEYLTQIIENKI